MEKNARRAYNYFTFSLAAVSTSSHKGMPKAVSNGTMMSMITRTSRGVGKLSHIMIITLFCCICLLHFSLLDGLHFLELLLACLFDCCPFCVHCVSYSELSIDDNAAIQSNCWNTVALG